MLFRIPYTTNLQFISVESCDSIHCVWQLSTVRQTWLVWLVVGSFEGWYVHIVMGRRSPSLKQRGRTVNKFVVLSNRRLTAAGTTHHHAKSGPPPLGKGGKASQFFSFAKAI